MSKMTPNDLHYETQMNLFDNYSNDEIIKLLEIIPDIMDLCVGKSLLLNNANKKTTKLFSASLIKNPDKNPLLISKKDFFIRVLKKIQDYFKLNESLLMVKSINILIEEFLKIFEILKISDSKPENSEKSSEKSLNQKKNGFKENNLNNKKNVVFTSETFNSINNKVKNKKYNNIKSHDFLNSNSEQQYEGNTTNNLNKCKRKESNNDTSKNITICPVEKNNSINVKHINNTTKKVKKTFSQFDLKIFFNSNDSTINHNHKKLMSLSKINKNKKAPVGKLKNRLYNNSNNLYINIYEHNKKENSNLNNKTTYINTNPNDNISMSIFDTNDLLKNIETEDFDIFELDNKIGPEYTLSLIGYYIYNRYGFCSLINYNKFENWCKKITKGYNRNNPYHTDLHAADITQTCLIYFKLGKINEIIKLSNLSKCSLFMSCICHDYKHPGVNNNYLRDTKNILAIKYNDNSILENMHISESFKLALDDKNCDIFSSMDEITYKKMRKEMISCVLSTDMTRHNNIIDFMKKVEKSENQKIDENLQLSYMNVFIHSADISNPTKKFNIYFKWAKLVVEEFYEQGDKEKILGMKCSCDRNVITLYQNQLGFINYIEISYFELLVKLFPKLQFVFDNLNQNKKILIEMQEKEKQESSNRDKK